MRRRLALTLALAASLAVDGRVYGQQPVFRTSTQSVSVDVSVRAGNVTVTGLASGDFRVFDNNVPQTVTAVAVESVPIDVTLFLDTSPSTSGHHDAMKSDIRTIAGMLRPDDRLRLLALDTQVRDVFGWQAPGGNLPLEALGMAWVSNVCDAIVAALMRRPDPDRRHLIVALTDGVDWGSVVGCRTLKALAPRAEAVLHVVLVESSLSPAVVAVSGPAHMALLTLPDADGHDSIEDAARSTGGQMHDTSGLFSRRDTVSAFKRAFDLFRESYVLRFTPQGVEPGGWHELKVEVPTRGRVTIRARRGYYGVSR
jgi:VWFA-related protein